MKFLLHYGLFVFVLVYFTIGESPRWELMRQTDYFFDVHHLEVLWYNMTYIKIEKAEMVKYNRSFQRVFNASGNLYKEIGLDFKVKIQLYKLHSNQYKYFPITVTLDMCHEYELNSFGSKDLLDRTSNLKPCPQKPGYLQVTHLYADPHTLPPLIPAGHYKLSAEFFCTEDQIANVDLYVEIIYKNKGF